MILRWLLAALHLLGLGIGLGAVWARARALREPLDRAGLARVFAADTWWGIAAAIWLSTGLVRLFSSLEKGSGYYFHNHFFLTKMALFLAILALEIGPMIAFIRWRATVGKGGTPDTSRASRYATISTIEAVLVICMVVAATAMARGL